MTKRITQLGIVGITVAGIGFLGMSGLASALSMSMANHNGKVTIETDTNGGIVDHSINTSDSSNLTITPDASGRNSSGDESNGIQLRTEATSEAKDTIPVQEKITSGSISDTSASSDNIIRSSTEYNYSNSGSQSSQSSNVNISSNSSTKDGTGGSSKSSSKSSLRVRVSSN